MNEIEPATKEETKKSDQKFKPEKKSPPPQKTKTPAFAQPQPPKIEPKKHRRHHQRAKNAFDIEVSEEEFDFEANLKLFDKEAVFKEIESSNGGQPPDLVRQIGRKPEDKYRHDENVLQQLTNSFRQIQLEFNSKNVYFTDEGSIIPSIPPSLRNRIQNLADCHGFDMNRQNDMLARGACDLSLQLLGGTRRLLPKNQHQWVSLKKKKKNY